MDRARLRSMRRAAAARSVSGGSQASPAPAPGDRRADSASEPMSLAASRRKRAARIAKRAAMEAARAGSVGAGSLEAAQRELEDGSQTPSPESLLLGDAAARAGGGIKTAGRFAARRAKADAIRLAASRKGSSGRRAVTETAMAVSDPAAAAAPMAAAPARSRAGRARRRTAKSWTLKTIGMGVETVASDGPSAMGRFLSGASPIPRPVRASRRPARGLMAGIAAGGLLPILVIGALVFSIPLVAGGAAALAGGQNKTSTGSLNGNAQVIAANLLAKDLDPMHVAAIMGNMYKESGYDPSVVNGIGAFGICQWLGGRKGGLINLCRERGVPETDLNAQIDWCYMELMVQGGAMGWNSVADRDRFLAFEGDGDLEEATAFFARKFERCGEGEMDLPTRTGEAKKVLEALRSSKGPEYMASDEVARRIADAATKVPSPGNGLCAMWVSQVYELAGCGYTGGASAAAMYDAFCSSSDRSQLKVGMAVAVSCHQHTQAGKQYGHIGIYIGDGKVMHNIGPIETWDLDRWISYYGDTVQVRWGYPPGVEQAG